MEIRKRSKMTPEEIDKVDHIVAFTRAYKTNLHKAIKKGLKRLPGRNFTGLIRFYRENYMYSEQYKNTEIRCVDDLTAFYKMQEAVHLSIRTKSCTDMEVDLVKVLSKMDNIRAKSLAEYISNFN